MENKINDQLSEKALSVFGEQNLDNVLQKAIVTGLQYFDETQYITVDHDGVVDLAKVENEIKGKIVVLPLVFTREEVISFLQEKAPDLIKEVDNPNWKNWMLTPFRGDWVTTWPEVEPMNYFRLQDMIADTLNEIADNWF